MTAGEAASAAVVPRHRGQLGWPAWLAGAAVFACLTLGTVAILAKNVANAFYVEGGHQFESVGPAAMANLVVQALAAVFVAVMAIRRPTWRSTALLATAGVSLVAFVCLDAWANSSVPA